MTGFASSTGIETSLAFTGPLFRPVGMILSADQVAAAALKELDLATIALQLHYLEKALRKRRCEEECVRHCVVCHERAREVAFDPCGHFVCCSECGLRVSTCPLCRGAIEKKLRIYVG